MYSTAPICKAGNHWKVVVIYLSIYLSIVYAYLLNLSRREGFSTRSVFERRLTSLNSRFSFSFTVFHPKVKELSLPCYLPIDRKRIEGYIPFPRVLVVCKMLAVFGHHFISYDDNLYNPRASINKRIAFVFVCTSQLITQKRGIIDYYNRAYVYNDEKYKI